MPSKKDLPNLITAGRLLLTALLALMLMCEQSKSMGFFCWLLFSFAAATDWVDGYLARRFEAVSTLGKLLDPLADKLLVSTALVMLIPLGRLPAWVALLILSREMFITGLRGAASSEGIVVAASNLGKIKSITQYFGLGTLIFPLGILPVPNLHQLGMGLVYVALVLTLWSGIDYFWKLHRVFFS